MSDEKFRRCIDALDKVTEVFSSARKEIAKPPGEYEADFAAYRLMQQVWVHVNSFSTVAAIPYPGSHLGSAWVIVRAALECGVIAMWLVHPEDWRERECRWLQWAATEEDHHRRCAGDIQAESPDTAERSRRYANLLEERRQKIAAMLPNAQLSKRPSMQQLFEEAGLPRQNYLAYRIASQLAHGGAGMDEFFLRTENGATYLGGSATLAAWINSFQIAGWAIVQPGIYVLARHECPGRWASWLQDTQQELVEATKLLADE